MFGALLGLFGLGAAGVGEAKRICKDGGYRDSAYKNGNAIYVDSKGVTRSVKTNNKVTKIQTIKEVTYYRDTKTHEKIKEINEYYLRQKNQAKAEAERRGLLTYFIMRGPKESGHFLVSNDLPVIQSGSDIEIPQIKLLIDGYNCHTEDELIKENRDRLYFWYKNRWYKYGNNGMDYRNEIIQLTNQYGVKIFQEDLNYCQNMMNTEKFKEVNNYRIDPVYAKAEWVDSKYWSWR